MAGEYLVTFTGTFSEEAIEVLDRNDDNDVNDDPLCSCIGSAVTMGESCDFSFWKGAGAFRSGLRCSTLVA